MLHILLFLIGLICTTGHNEASRLLTDGAAGGAYQNQKSKANLRCDDDYSPTTCARAQEKNLCKNKHALLTLACRKSCGLCNSGETDEFRMSGAGRQGSVRASKCVDQIPMCSVTGSGMTQQQFCCSAQEFMNRTCAKTCKFCLEMGPPILPVQGMPGMPLPGAVPAPATVVTQQNPCDPSNPPSAGLNPPTGR